MCLHYVGYDKITDGAMVDVKLYRTNDLSGMGKQARELKYIFAYCPDCGKKLWGKNKIDKQQKRIKKQKKIIDKLAEWLSIDDCPHDIENRFCKNGDTDAEKKKCKNCWIKCVEVRIENELQIKKLDKLSE